MHSNAILYDGGGDAQLTDEEVDLLIEYLLNLR